MIRAHGTWTFDRDYPVGQFYLGYWWVIGPVTINSKSHGWVGQVLETRLMGAVDLWSHPAYFDYVDRWVG